MTPSDTISPTVFAVADDQPTLDALEVSLDVLGFAVRAFSSLEHFSYFYRPEVPGCLLLDLHSIGQGVDGLTAQLKQVANRLPTIVIAESDDASSPLKLDGLRAADVMPRSFDRDTLVEHVRRALALDAEWRERDAQIAALEERIRQLDNRDRETLEMMQAGESNKTMAAKLRLTQRAVEMRRSAIMRKLKVASVAELTSLAALPNVLAEVRTAVSERQYR
jgi:FixJ family two-component response regulator